MNSAALDNGCVGAAAERSRPSSSIALTLYGSTFSAAFVRTCSASPQLPGGKDAAFCGTSGDPAGGDRSGLEPGKVEARPSCTRRVQVAARTLHCGGPPSVTPQIERGGLAREGGGGGADEATEVRDEVSLIVVPGVDGDVAPPR